MNILGIVPARKGSKGLKGKNIKELGGKPLIDYTFKLVSSLEIIDKIYLTTNDDAIIDLATQHKRVNVPFIRPAKISKDKTPMHEVVSHLISYCDEIDEKYDYIVLFQPTTPFRNKQEVLHMIQYAIDNNLESLFAVTNVWHHPSEYIRVSNNKFDYILNPKESSRRQDFEKVYFITGALYIVSTSFFKKTQTFITEESKPYILSEETMIDIDNAFHFNLAKAYVKSWLN